MINSSHISRSVGRRPVFVYQLSKSESDQLIPYFPAPWRTLFLLPHKVKVKVIISSLFSPQLGEPCFCCPVKWEVMDLQVMERRVGATPLKLHLTHGFLLPKYNNKGKLFWSDVCWSTAQHSNLTQIKDSSHLGCLWVEHLLRGKESLQVHQWQCFQDKEVDKIN